MLSRSVTVGIGRATIMALAALLVVGAATPAAAQRPGRRWRAAQPAPRPAPARPASPTPSKPSTSSGSQTKPAPAKEKAPVDAGKGSLDRPQTTAAEAPRSLQGESWDGPVPFGDAWRSSHPAAWRPEEEGGEVILAGGPLVPTGADQIPSDLAQWTAPTPIAGQTPRSVLQVSGEESGETAASPSMDHPDELVVFPGADGSIPLVPAAGERPGEQQAAADGTVSVLVREGNPPSQPVPAAAPSVVARLDADEPGASPWLPLGAFAAVPSTGQPAPAPHVFFELSLHRDGTVRGNYFDAVSDAVIPVKGRFDRDTGSLTWKIGGGGAEFEASADELVAGRVEAAVRKGQSERSWTLIGLP